MVLVPAAIYWIANSLEVIILHREPLICVENIIPGLELPEFQNTGVQEALLNKKMMLSFDTGMGKTYTYALFVRGLLNRNPENKHIFVIIHDSLEQAPKDLRNLAAAPVGAFSSAEGELSSLVSQWKQLSIIVLTYECFRDINLVLFLYKHLGEVESLVIDEAHHVANWDTSDTAFMIRALASLIPYVCELTATPITSEKSQYYRAMNLMDRSLSYRRDETFAGAYNQRYMAANRKDYDIKGNYKTTLELVPPMAHQIGKIRGVISRKIKGTGAILQVDRLIELIRARLKDGKSVIVYINYHDTREWVESHLAAEGISFVSLHGKIIKRDERQDILDTFSERRADVLLTSVAESLNIDSDVVIFYEFTTKIKQVMGRAHRGLEGKELELVFILTKDTDEVEYFMKYIYHRSLTIQKLLGKDYSEFIKVGEQIQRLALD